MLPSATLNDLASYSNNPVNKHLKFVSTTSMNDLQMCHDAVTTPIRFNKVKLTTPISMQRRRALGLVNHNSHQIPYVPSSDDLSTLMSNKMTQQDKLDETSFVQTPIRIDDGQFDDDLPHQSHANSSYADTFDDLIPAEQRIERLMSNFDGGINLFSYCHNIENTIRCQSPMSSRLNIATLLDMVDPLN
jgi:hypothetical protein